MLPIRELLAKRAPGAAERAGSEALKRACRVAGNLQETKGGYDVQNC